MKWTDDEFERLLKEMGPEEPSMSFTRNVMEQVKLEVPPVSLKTRVDKRIIYSIGGLFAACIFAVFIYAAANTDFTYALPKVNIANDVTLDKNMVSILLTAFLFIDIIIALIYFDRILRRKQA